MNKEQIERPQIIILIESMLIYKIEQSIMVYFNNMRTNSTIAINDNLDFIKYLISQYYDFITHKNNFTYRRLSDIYHYLLNENYNIPYLQKEISEQKFLEIFDYINETFKFEDSVITEKTHIDETIQTIIDEQTNKSR